MEKDARLFADLLESLGHTSRLIAYDRPHVGISYPADINLFMEVMLPDFFHNAAKNWLMPNSEWWDYKQYDRVLPQIDKILCKTADCLRIWEAKCPGRCVYTGFESADYYIDFPCEQKENAFLHLAGNSQTKNTQAVVDAWIQYAIPYNLELVIRDISWIPRVLGKKNITFRGRIPENDVQMALNYRWFHIMPSHYEGFGHVIHEALGCGGIVLTTNAPPMSEIKGVPSELLIPVASTWQRELATCNTVSPEAVYHSVMNAVALPLDRRIQISRIARQSFLQDRKEFRLKVAELLA